jgi:hypothetical protein
MAKEMAHTAKEYKIFSLFMDLKIIKSYSFAATFKR